MSYARCAAMLLVAATMASFSGNLHAKGDEAASGDGEVVITDEARKHFKIGVNLLKDPDGARYEEAYRAFKAAYAASPSPKILNNLGLCALKLERDSEAIWAYTEYLSKVPDVAPDQRSQIETDIETLKGNMVPIVLTVDPPDAQVVDERVPVKGNKIINNYEVLDGKLEVGVRAGRHIITVKREGLETQTWELAANPGETAEKSITLKEPATDAPEPDAPPQTTAPQEEPGLGTGFFIGVGATAALAIGTGVVGALALGKGGAFNDLNTGADPAAAQAARDDAATLNIVTDVLLGTTVLAAGATVALFLIDSGSDEPEADSTDSAWSLVPAAGPQGGGMWLRGRF